MKCKSSQVRDRFKRIQKVALIEAEKAGNHNPYHEILVERLVRQGVNRDIAEGFARHLDRQKVT